MHRILITVLIVSIGLGTELYAAPAGGGGNANNAAFVNAANSVVNATNTLGNAQNTGSPGGIIQTIVSFLPFAQLVQTVDTCMPIFNLVALFLILVATVQEIPKHPIEGVFIVIVRSIVIVAVIAMITPLMTNGELLAQGIVRAIASATNPPLNWIVNAASGDPRGSILYNFGQPFSELNQFWANGMQQQGGLGNILSSSWNGFTNGITSHGWNVFGDIGSAITGGLGGAAGGAAEDLLSLILTLFIGATMVFSEFIMELMLLLQKAILVFGRLLMPPFIGLLSWQGPSRFLGVNYNQSILGVMAWPIGWALVNVGTEAGLKNLQSLNANWHGGFLALGFMFINVFLICTWMVVGTVMAPVLIQKVVTAGGHFAASMMGGFAGKALGAPSAALGAAGTAAGAAIGSMGGPAGMALGASIGGAVGGRLGSTGTTSLGSAVSQATGDGGGGGGGVGGGSSARAASMMYMAQMGRQGGGGAA